MKMPWEDNISYNNTATGTCDIKELLLENKDNLIGEPNFGLPISEYKGATEMDYYRALDVIPIKWVVNWLTKQTIPATHTCDDYEAVEMMLDDWEKENESNTDS